MIDILFMPKLKVQAVGFGDYRMEGDKVVGSVIVEYERPDPKQCAIIRNVMLPAAEEGDK